MKPLRRLYLVLLVAAAVGALTVAALLAPPVQRWIALRMLSAPARGRVGVERVVARPGVLSVRKLTYAWPGGRLTIASGALKLSIWDLVFHRHLRIHDARIEGLAVQLARRPPPGRPASGAAVTATGAGGERAAWSRRLVALARSAGLVGHFRLPWGLQVRHCTVDAVVTWPAEERHPPGDVAVHLTGGQLIPGQTAKFDFDARARAPGERAAVAAVEARGTLTATLGSGSILERMGLHCDTVARGPKLAAPARLQIHVGVARTATGENYGVLLTPVAPAGADPLLSLNAEYTDRLAELSGTWQVKTDNRQIAPFAFGWSPPEFSVAGEGRFAYRFRTGAARLSGQMNGDFSRFGIFDPRLAPLGRLAVGTEFNVDLAGDNLRVTQFLAHIRGGKPTVVVQSLQPFTLALKNLALTASDHNRGLLQARLEDLPVAWLRPWLHSRLTIRGEGISGVLDAALVADRLRLRTRTPLKVDGVTVSRAGKVLLPPCNFAVRMEAERGRADTQVRLTGITVTTAAGDRLEAAGEFRTTYGAAPQQTVRAEFTGILPTLAAAYVPDGPVEVRGGLSLSHAGADYRIGRLSAIVKSRNGPTRLSIESRQPVLVDTKTGQVSTLSGGSGPLLGLSIDHLRLGGLSGWVKGLQVEGELASGGLLATGTAGAVHFSMPAPWRLRGVTVAAGGRPCLKDLSGTLEGTADYAAGEFTGSLSGIDVHTAAGRNLMSAQASGSLQMGSGRPQVDGKASFELTVAALAGQPALAGLKPAEGGKLSGEVSFSYERNLLGKGRLTLNGLVAPATGVPLPVANLSFRVGIADNGDIAVQMPLLIDRAGERSDLTLAGTLRPDRTGRTIDARVTSSHLVVDDVLALLDALAGTGSPVAAPAPETAAPRPAWHGLTGTVVVDAKSVFWGRTLRVKDLAGRCTIAPAKVVADRIAAQLDEGALLQGRVEIDYAAGRAEPYTADLDLAVKGLDVAPFFKAAAPGRPPILEGRFDIHGRARGAGRTLAGLVAHTRGDCLMQCRKGVFRGLRRPPNPPRPGIVGSATRILGHLGEKVENLAAGTDVTGELAGLLSDLHFDQFNVRLARDAALNLRLTDLSLVSPTVRLQGEGRITREAGKNVLEQPLQLHLSMGVTGAVAKAITRAKLPVLSGERDDLGYQKLREPFQVDGTLVRPDPGQLYAMLSRSLLDILLH